MLFVVYRFLFLCKIRNLINIYLLRNAIYSLFMHVLENIFFCAFICFIRRILYSYEVHIHVVHITLLKGKCREEIEVIYSSTSIFCTTSHTQSPSCQCSRTRQANPLALMQAELYFWLSVYFKNCMPLRWYERYWFLQQCVVYTIFTSSNYFLSP